MKQNLEKTRVRFLQALAIGACYVWLIVRPEDASLAAAGALSLCAKVIVPSLFPFFVCANLFCALHLTQPLERALSGVMQPVFGVPGSGAAALVVGLTGGYPSGAQTIAALYAAGSIDKKSAGRLLLFCNNCGPAFIFGVVGPAVFGSRLAGLLLYIVHCTSALLLGTLPRKKTAVLPSENTNAAQEAPPSFSAALTVSVRKAGQTALEVCMFVLLFGVLTALVQSALKAFLPPLALTALSGILELSGGAGALAELSTAQGVKFTLASMLLAFGGLSVHAQTRAVLTPTGLGSLPVFLPKLLHALTAGLLSIPVYRLFDAQLASSVAFAACGAGAGFALMELTLSVLACLIFRKMAASNLHRDRV